MARRKEPTLADLFNPGTKAKDPRPWYNRDKPWGGSTSRRRRKYAPPPRRRRR